MYFSFNARKRERRETKTKKYHINLLWQIPWSIESLFSLKPGKHSIQFSASRQVLQPSEQAKL